MSAALALSANAQMIATYLQKFDGSRAAAERYLQKNGWAQKDIASAFKEYDGAQKPNGHSTPEETKFAETAPDAFRALTEPPAKTVPIESIVPPPDAEPEPVANEPDEVAEDELETLRAENAALREKAARAEKVAAETLDTSAEKIHEAEAKADDAFLETLAAKAHKRRKITSKDVSRAADIQRRKLEEAERAKWPDLIGETAGVLSPVLPFNPDFLPRAIRPWAVDISELMGTPLDFPGIALIVAVAGITGRRVFVYPREFNKEWKESICLSGGIVAESGALKTPTSKAVLDPVNAVEAEMRRQFQKEVAQYREALAAYEKSVAVNKKDSTKEVLPEPKEPVAPRRIITNDATPEAIHTLLERNPEGVLYHRDELAGWVADLGKKGYESMKSIFLAGMNGNDYHTMDRIGRGDITATMCISIWGSFQPVILRSFLNQGNAEDGTVQRFSLMIWPDDVKRKGLDRTPNNLAKSQVARVMSIIASMKEKSIAFHFDKEAQPIFNEWRDAILEKAEQSQGWVRSHLSKYPGALAKVAALYQLVDLVTDTPNSVYKPVTFEREEPETKVCSPDLSGNHSIDAAHLQMAIKLFEYLESHMNRVYNCIVSSFDWAEEIIGQHILAGDLRDGFTAREIQRKQWAGLDHKKSSAGRADFIELALENLEEKGWVRRQIQEAAGPGRPTVKWEINPKLEQWANGGKNAEG